MPVSREKSKPAPTVIVFDGTSTSTSSSSKGASKAEYKTFMSTKLSKLTAKPVKRTKEEIKEDQESRQKDRELKELLDGKLMIEKLHESQLTGKERQNHNLKKLASLGMKIKTKHNIPTNEYFNAQRNKQQRLKAEMQDAKDRGILNNAMKRDLEIKHLGKLSGGSGRKPMLKMGDRGMRLGEGRFKDGVLHISKNHIDRVNGKASAQGRVGKKNSGKSKGKKSGGGQGKRR